MNADVYVGEKDVSRMRQVMIARKADITRDGGIREWIMDLKWFPCQIYC